MRKPFDNLRSDNHGRGSRIFFVWAKPRVEKEIHISDPVATLSFWSRLTEKLGKVEASRFYRGLPSRGLEGCLGMLVVFAW